MCVCVYTNITHMTMNVYTQSHNFAHIQTRIHRHVYPHGCTYMYEYMYTCTFSHTHTHTCVCVEHPQPHTHLVTHNTDGPIVLPSSTSSMYTMSPAGTQ